MLVLGVLGAELFFSRVSLLILLAGLIILFQGWTFFRAVLFPWAFLILMIPIPNLLLQQVTFPLQLLAARLSTALLDLVNVPVLREGNVIRLAAMPEGLDVAEACSGIRSLLTLVTLAIAGAADTFTVVFRGTIVQQTTPEEFRGRVTAADYVVAVSGGQLGNLEAGTLGSLTSPTISALTGGLITVAAAVAIGLALPAFTRYRPQPRTEPQPHPQPHASPSERRVRHETLVSLR